MPAGYSVFISHAGMLMESMKCKTIQQHLKNKKKKEGKISPGKRLRDFGADLMGRKLPISLFMLQNSSYRRRHHFRRK